MTTADGIQTFAETSNEIDDKQSDIIRQYIYQKK